MVSEENNAKGGFVRDERREALIADAAKTDVGFHAIMTVPLSYGWRLGEALEYLVQSTFEG